ncbi:hypothetical protein [Desulfovibrio sp. UCD-KL4C]|uniref:hypothetical protein n=1 Tax=Desulfovibrio sp. UCD-KL4C TaxID=2578120 RepID=UPI0025C0361E|nr:hypothetical protein [Desulfovibrio sp. UCD-KL4C]
MIKSEVKKDHSLLNQTIIDSAQKLAQQDFAERAKLYDHIREPFGEFSDEWYLFKDNFEKELLSR